MLVSGKRARGWLRRAGGMGALALGCALGAGAHAQPATADGAGEDAQALYQRSMRNPGDVRLAYAAAEQAVARGDYEAAIGIYERVVDFDPQLVQVRLQLARLYYRLGSYETARSYFAPLAASGQLSASERENVAAYLTEIERRLAPNQWSLYAQAGVRYQSNASYGPSSRIVIGDDVAALLPPSYAAKADGSVFGLATVRHVYDFGTQRGDVWESNLNLYYSQQFDLERLNLGFVEFNSGPRFALLPDALPGSSVRAYGILGGVSLGGASYLGTYGVGASLLLPFHFGTLQPGPAYAPLGIEPFVELRQRNYNDTADYPTAGLQSGEMWTLGANLFGALTDSVRWRMRLAYNDASADVPWYGYDNFAVDLALPIEFEGLWGVKRWLAIPSIGYSRYDFDAANPFVSRFITRTDDQYRVGLALDVPVHELFGVLTQVQYTWSDSALPNYQFNNFSISVGPNVRF
ncbi:tetratricopeptide repeat protein [Xanthobacter sp. ZOL 2024]